MQIEDKHIEVFDKYYTNQLSESERNAFEADLATDEHLENAYHSYMTTVEGIRAFERKQLKQQLLNARSQQKTTKIRRIAGHWGRIAAAASLALLVSMGLYWCNQSNERIYANYALDRAENLMSIGSEDLPLERQRFQTAMALKDQKQYHEALSNLKNITDTNINLYFRAQYNIALIQLKLNDKAMAKTTLEALIKRSENHYLKGKAKAMLADLNRFCY